MKTRSILALLTLTLGLSPVLALAQQSGRPGAISLGQAVDQARQESRGQVLSAESRHYDRRTEYRIKVLTPQGHVRVMNISAGGNSSYREFAPPPRNPTGRRAGGMERH